MNKIIKNYHYYIINEDYTLKELGVTAPTSESEVPILNESEFKALKYSLESNDSPFYTLFKLCELHHEDEISYSFLAKILVNKKRFLVEVFERVDS